MEKIKTVVDLLGEDLVIEHIINGDYSLRVKMAMITSLDSNGVINADEEGAINDQAS